MIQDDLRNSFLPSAPHEELEHLAGVIEGISGVHVPRERWYTVFARLREDLDDAGSVPSYVLRLERDERIRERMLDVLCPHETRFFREPAQFEYLEDEVYPRWKREAQRGERSRRLRAWSAACATGEEPFSIAMSLRENFGADWEIEVLGTDISPETVAEANRGVWRISRAKEIRDKTLKRFMLRGHGESDGTMAAGAQLKALVHCRVLNLTADSYSVGGPFDLILCRNVLIYFRPEMKRKVAAQLSNELSTGGLLATGHAETLEEEELSLIKVGPTTYARQGAK